MSEKDMLRAEARRYIEQGMFASPPPRGSHPSVKQFRTGLLLGVVTGVTIAVAVALVVLS